MYLANADDGLTKLSPPTVFDKVPRRTTATILQARDARVA